MKQFIKLRHILSIMSNSKYTINALAGNNFN